MDRTIFVEECHIRIVLPFFHSFELLDFRVILGQNVQRLPISV